MPTDDDAGNRGFAAKDLLQQVMIRDLALAPDGAFAVYSRRTIEDNAYRTRLWRVPWEGGEPTPLTTADANDSDPRISPDGRSLLFVSDRSGESQAWLLPLAGGEARKLTDLKGGVQAARWSPDGRRIALAAESGVDRLAVGDPKDPVARRITDLDWRADGAGIRGMRTAAWVLDLAGGEPRRLTAPEVDVAAVSWLADGRVAVVANLRPDPTRVRTAMDADVWAFDVDADDPEAAMERLTTIGGGVFVAEAGPDGALAVIGTRRQPMPNWANADLFLVDGAELRQLGVDRDLSVVNGTFGDLIDSASAFSLAWRAPGEVVALVGTEGRSLPYLFRAVDPAAAEPLAEGDLVCSTLACGSGWVAVVATDRGQPGEVYALEDGVLRPLTDHGSAWLAPWRRDPVRHRVPHPDGHAIDVWVVPARSGEPARNGVVDGDHGAARQPGPAVLHVHGGPHAAHGPTPWLEMLALADAGITVLYPNPRGSTGYGEAFAAAIHGSWGETDGADHLRVVEWAVAEGLADPARFGVMGLSGGGYMTTWLLGRHPGVFAAGVSENPVTDLIGMYGSSDLTTWMDERFVGVGRLPEDTDRFLRHSPFTALHNNEAPLLLLQSDDDLRCPPAQSELAFAILKSRGRTVEMIRYPGEAHYLVGEGRPDRRVDRIERIVAWFREHL
jgi:dipeptidyl aminopeptidase/acylaminoacyl peptidase